MRQPTKGPVLKERVWCFIEALLTRAEDSSDFDVGWEKDKNTGRPNFVVKTKRRFLESLAQLKKQELTDVIKSLENLRIWDDRRLRRGKGSEIGSFALKLWSTDAQRNWEQFDRIWEDSRPDKSKDLEETFKKAPLTPQFWGEQDQTTSVLPPKVGGAGGGIEWRDICLAMLEKQKRLTTNELLYADEDMKFELDDIHVPLALVQRTKPDKRGGDVSPEEGSRLLQPSYEEKQRFKHEEFLAQVLQEGKGQSKGRRIAVIGEPGAGKTTLLQSIAFWLFEDKNKNLGLPIWISLADLQGKTLEEYLLQRWLKNALEVARVTPEQENALVELFKKERVWLFLDGVDEIAGDSAKAFVPLQMVASQLEGWVAKARVVLSCRLNVWEANINALGDDFDTYRLLDFDYPLQVKEFICRWFRKTDADKGEGLWAELDKSERQRIQDLVKNPLRLALLCSTWQSSDQGLPSTKAGLYEQFLKEFYKWKENRFPTTQDQQEELNAALGRLAKRAIDQEASRFRLQHKLVRDELGDPKQQGSLFWLALQLGWLNKVGLAAESETEEKVYAFFHPTFQEYFAALAVEDWDFFLPRAHDNHNPKPVSERYRIFEPQWKEVILLWLGREEVAKEEFIKALVEFEDGCNDFYWYQAYFLAADGIAEFEDCNLADEIVEQIVKWSFSDSHLDPIKEEARVKLGKSQNSSAIPALVQLLNSTENESTRRLVVANLGKFAAGNTEAITALVQLLNSTEDQFTLWQTVKTLQEVVPGISTVISALIQQINSTEGIEIPWQVKAFSGVVGGGIHEAITALVQQISSSEDESTRWQAATLLGLIGAGNPIAISALVQLLNSSEDESTRWQAATILGKSNPRNSTAISALVQLLNSTEDKSIRWKAAESLRKIDPGNPEAISALVQLLNSTEDEFTHRQAVARSLGEIGTENPEAMSALVQLLNSTEDEFIRWQAAESLGKIDPGNLEAIAALVQLLNSTEDELIRWQTAESLKEILRDNQLAEIVTALKDCLSDRSYENHFDRFEKCYNLIWHSAQNMSYPGFYQAWHPQDGVEKTTTAYHQSLNQSVLPQSLQSAIANDRQLSQTIHLICIDGRQFIEPDRPAAEIYDQMLDQNCPECDSVPETMSALKLYWNSLKRKSHKRVVLVFYASSTDTTSAKDAAMSCPYSEAFLSDLSKFGDRVCVVTEQPFDRIPLKHFTPSHAIEDVMEWIRAIAFS